MSLVLPLNRALADMLFSSVPGRIRECGRRADEGKQLTRSSLQFGPLFIHPIFYFAPKLIYGKAFEHSKMQKCGFSLAARCRR